MKNIVKALVILLSIVSFHSAYADDQASDIDAAKMQVHISGPIDSFYICTSNNGCTNMRMADQGKVIMMDPGKVEYIFASNMKNLTMSEQSLPASCQVSVAKNDTLVVTGKLLVKDSKHYGIENLKCKVVA